MRGKYSFDNLNVSKKKISSRSMVIEEVTGCQLEACSLLSGKNILKPP